MRSCQVAFCVPAGHNAATNSTLVRAKPRRPSSNIVESSYKPNETGSILSHCANLSQPFYVLLNQQDQGHASIEATATWRCLRCCKPHGKAHTSEPAQIYLYKLHHSAVGLTMAVADASSGQGSGLAVLDLINHVAHLLDIRHLHKQQVASSKPHQRHAGQAEDGSVYAIVFGNRLTARQLCYLRSCSS